MIIAYFNKLNYFAGYKNARAGCGTLRTVLVAAAELLIAAIFFPVDKRVSI